MYLFTEGIHAWNNIPLNLAQNRFSQTLQTCNLQLPHPKFKWEKIDFVYLDADLQYLHIAFPPNFEQVFI